MEPNEVPPPQPGHTWVIRNNADMVLYMCTMCQITPEHYYRRLDAIEAHNQTDMQIVARVMAKHNAQNEAIKAARTDTKGYNEWVAKKAKQGIKKRR